MEVRAPPELSTFMGSTPSLALVMSLPDGDPFVGGSTDVVCDDATEPGVDDVDVSASVSGVVEAAGSGSASGLAQATPGVVATATPTPSDTASAPTRPMYLA
ncbi:MAG TPA: hypothetical protein VGO30_06935 [Mycobacterium sp.]|nr:hypothetical protein [Mycobacterium sp.]